MSASDRTTDLVARTRARQAAHLIALAASSEPSTPSPNPLSGTQLTAGSSPAQGSSTNFSFLALPSVVSIEDREHGDEIAKRLKLDAEGSSELTRFLEVSGILDHRHS